MFTVAAVTISRRFSDLGRYKSSEEKTRRTKEGRS
jgi:hypothetical protein